MTDVSPGQIGKWLTPDPLGPGDVPHFSFQHLISKIQRIEGAPIDVIEALVAGLQYTLRIDKDQRETGPFEPWIRDAQGVVSPCPPNQLKALGARRDFIMKVWSAATNESSDPMIRARFADILWEADVLNKHQLAETAIRSYLEALKDNYWANFKRSHCGVRALELAQRLGHKSLVEDSKSRLAWFLEQLLNEQPPSAGAVLPLLNKLVEPKVLEPVQANQYLGRVRASFSNDVYLQDDIDVIELKSHPNADRRDRIMSDAIQRRENAATDADGIAALHHLQKALEFARRSNRSTDEKRVQQKIQSINRSGLNMHEITVEVRITEDAFKSFTTQIVGSDSSADALHRFGTIVPLPARDDVSDLIRANLEQAPLINLFQTTYISQDGYISAHSNSSEDNLNLRRRRYEAQLIHFFSYSAIDVLSEIVRAYGKLDVKPLLTECVHVDDETIEPIVFGLNLYENGHFDASSHVLVPRIERISRSMAQSLGAKSLKSNNFGGSEYTTLKQILDQLSGLVEPDTVHYLDSLLVQDLSLNLRNRIAHGLNNSFSQGEAALVIHSLCHLLQFREKNWE